MSTGALSGLRVLELGQLVAGSMAGAVLAWLGADVVKVEPPGGDPLRRWRGMEAGNSLWWHALHRNKRGLVLDLRAEAGQATARRLAGAADVLIENFRPGTLERWGLAPEALQAENPGLIVARISGFGQTGPARARLGYASTAEAIAGLRHVTGVPGEPPVRANLSLGDSAAALQAVIGVLTALYHRDARGGAGQIVDVALVEALITLTESMLSEAQRLGQVRGPSGSTVSGVAPTNTYRCADGRYVVIAANGPGPFRRLCAALGEPERADDPRFIDNPARVTHVGELDAWIGAWAAARSRAEVCRALEAAEVPFGAVQDAAELLEDPQLEARGALERVLLGGRPLVLPPLGPKLSETPGRSLRRGPELDEHGAEVLAEWLG